MYGQIIKPVTTRIGYLVTIKLAVVMLALAELDVAGERTPITTVCALASISTVLPLESITSTSKSNSSEGSILLTQHAGAIIVLSI